MPTADEQYKNISRKELVAIIIDREYTILLKDERISSLEQQNNLIKYTLDNIFKIMNQPIPTTPSPPSNTGGVILNNKPPR